MSSSYSDPALLFLTVAAAVGVGATFLYYLGKGKKKVPKTAPMRPLGPPIPVPQVHNQGKMQMAASTQTIVRTEQLLNRLSQMQPGQSMWLQGGPDGRVCLVEKLKRTSGAQYDSYMWKWTCFPAGPSMQEYTMEALCAQLSVQGFVRAD